ncbi:hypothetical protein FHS16_002490 [Paenibacillus endophyticus]|uniref:Heparinase II/III-like protein n=1 Tax=Paenibacillus endophyticus TaxID=1294268 RepID=A0A7W5GA67_9BACL|nr:heparinase II/III family protein [Paenibacillus endophyticus]MBB3152440.1 hypothetical protein [Paenibacillus endophyticus]
MKREQIESMLELGRKRGISLILGDSAPDSLWGTALNGTLMEEIRADADNRLKAADPELTFSLFRVFGDTGERLAYENVYFDRRKRMNAFVIMALQEPGNKLYETAALDTIWSICNEFTWCLPAHFNERAEKPDIDLFAAETGFALSEVLLLLGERLPRLLRERIETEIENRLFRPFLELGPYGWETAEHNWSAVCAGSIGAAALHLMNDTGRLSELLARVLRSLDYYLDGFGEDGACAEGYSYWQYGFGYFVYFAQLLKEATEGRMDLFEARKVKEIALFQQKSFTSGNAVVNFSDAPNESGIFMGLSCCLHKEYPEVIVPDASLRAAYSSDYCGRWAPAVRNLMWAKEEWLASSSGKALWPAESYYLPDVAWLLSRHVSTNGGSYSFSAKGGHNAEPHNHNDVGHFLLHADGQAYLADLGSGKYTADYFGKGRYAIWCNGSQGHSVPIVNGSHQQAGQQFRAKVVEAASAEGEDLLEIEISGAYGLSQLERLGRRFHWQKEELPCLSLIDRFSFLPGEGDKGLTNFPITERFISYLAPELTKAGELLFIGKRRLRMIYNHQLWSPVVTARSDIDHYGSERHWHTIDFEASALPAVPFIAAFTFQFDS